MAIAALACVAGGSSTAPAQPGQSRSEADLKAKAAEIAYSYLSAFSTSSDGAAGSVPYIYGPTVRFYGRTYTQAALADEKRRAARKWPVRRYDHRPGTMQITCNGGRLRCVAQSIIDYQVGNPATGKSARGSTSFDLGISFEGPRPLILYESGRIRGRDPSA